MSSDNRAGLMDKLALGVFLIGLLIVAFGVGIGVAHYKVFPYYQIENASLTVRSLFQRTGHAFVGDFVDVEPSDGPPLETIVADAGDETFLIYGGLNAFPEECPEFGCVAVEMNRAGEIVRSWPYRPYEIQAANISPEYEYQMLGFDAVQSPRLFGAKVRPDGDIYVTFSRTNQAQLFPFGAGVSRLAPDGTPRWHRMDYTHHWPILLENGNVLTTAMVLREGPIPVPRGTSNGPFKIDCREPYIDVIREISADGEEVKEINVLDMMIESEFRGLLRDRWSPCDPLHLNYVDVLNETAAGAIEGVEPGDYVVSLRYLSILAILDQNDGHVKRIGRGTFNMQHSIHHLEGSKFLMFDNLGGTLLGQNARLVEFDIETGETRNIFPQPGERHEPWLQDAISEFHGDIDISPDRERALVSFSRVGVVLEIRISDGEVLTRYENVHEFEGERRMFQIMGMDYLSPETGANTPS